MKQASEMDALVHRLEVSGADRTRWPAQERLRFAPLIAQNEEARRLLAETAALDRLLDHAPAPDTGRTAALVDRIVAAAEAEGTGSAKVVTFQAAPGKARTGRALLRDRTMWQAAALLAASLFVGAFVGTSGLLQSGVGTFVQVADVDDSLDATELVIDGNRGDLLGEDVL